MACKKYLIYNSVEATASYNLYKFLEQYAVPDYFSRIEFDSETLLVTCYNIIDDAEVPAMLFGRTNNYNFVTVYYNNASGTARTASKYYCTSTSSQARCLVAGYVTDNGIAVSTAKENTTEGTMIAMITKDNCGNTTIITETETFSCTYNNVNIVACNGYNSAVVCACRCTAVPSIAATTLSPILIPDYNCGYTPNVYVMPFAENRSVGILELNGKRYLSNGVICMRCDSEEAST